MPLPYQGTVHHCRAILVLQGPNMTQHKYPTAFPLKHQQKDLRLALELAQEHGQELPTASAANRLYEQV